MGTVPLFDCSQYEPFFFLSNQNFLCCHVWCIAYSYGCHTTLRRLWPCLLHNQQSGSWRGQSHPLRLLFSRLNKPSPLHSITGSAALLYGTLTQHNIKSNAAHREQGNWSGQPQSIWMNLWVSCSTLLLLVILKAWALVHSTRFISLRVLHYVQNIDTEILLPCHFTKQAMMETMAIYTKTEELSAQCEDGNTDKSIERLDHFFLEMAAKSRA